MCEFNIQSKIYFLAACVLFLGSCKKAESNKTTAFVYKATPYHLGSGVYRERVYYRYAYRNTVYEGFFRYKLGTMYDLPVFEQGDSILISYKEKKPWKSEFIRMAYDKDFMEGLIWVK